jgi:putative transposase
MQKKAPTAAILDAQSVKMADQPGERGFDAGKKVVGRKRHLLVDSLGLILVAVVHSAAIQDREGAKLVIEKARWFGWLRVIFADAAYSGQLVSWVREFFGRQGTRLSIIPKLGTGFRILAKRWIVERTFSWFTHYRRLSKDYEVKTEHSEAFIYAAATRLMLRRLAPSSLK